MEKRQRYSKEFKVTAVELVKTGKPIPEVAEELAIGSGLLYRWATQASKQENGIQGVVSVGEQPLSNELQGLRRENARLRLENDILKKAAVILGNSPQLSAAR
jgi:transposase